jgi:hypothetical protein
LSHIPARTDAVLDDPNLVSHGGLVPVMALAERAGLPELLAEHVRPGGGCGANAPLKAGCLVAGIAAGADPVDDVGLLRHGAMDVLFGGVRAPPTLGSHLRSCTWGSVLQLEKAGRELLARLPRQAPLPPGADVPAPSPASTRRRNGPTAIRRKAPSSAARRSRGNRSWSAG